MFWKTLFLFLLRGFERRLSRLRLGSALLEFIHAACRIHEFLLTGVEGMAGIADTHDDHRPGGAGLDHVAAGAPDLGIHVLGMNVCLHKKGANNSRRDAGDKREFEDDRRSRSFAFDFDGLAVNLNA